MGLGILQNFFRVSLWPLSARLCLEEKRGLAVPLRLQRQDRCAAREAVGLLRNQQLPPVVPLKRPLPLPQAA